MINPCCYQCRIDGTRWQAYTLTIINAVSFYDGLSRTGTSSPSPLYSTMSWGLSAFKQLPLFPGPWVHRKPAPLAISARPSKLSCSRSQMLL